MAWRSTATAIAAAAIGGPSLDARAVEVASSAAVVAIEELPEGESVEFRRDVRPLFEKSCLACHSASTAEADVVLESVESMLAYDVDDPLIVLGDASAGKLLPVAAGLQEPAMPPEDNGVGAARLTPFELGQIKRWIELGTPVSSAPHPAPRMRWRPIPSHSAPIMATAVTTRESFALAAHGNRVDIYNIAQGRREASLVDTSLSDVDPGYVRAAHLDAVRSVATVDNGELIATGGYRTVKLWRRVRTSQELVWPASSTTTKLATSAMRDWIATGHEDGSIMLGRRDVNSGESSPVHCEAHAAPIVGLSFVAEDDQLVSIAADGSVRRWRIPGMKRLGEWHFSPPPRAATLLVDTILATTASDLTLRTYRLPGALEEPHDGDEVKTTSAALEPELKLRGHGREITTAVAVPDQQLLLTGGRDGFLRLWDVETGAENRSWIHGRAVVAIAAQTGGARFVSVDDLGVAKMWVADRDEPEWTSPVDDRSAQQLSRAERAVQLADGNVETFQQALKVAQQQQKTDDDRAASAESELQQRRQVLAEAEAAAEAARRNHQSILHASKRASELAAAARQVRETLRPNVGDFSAMFAEIDAVWKHFVPPSDGDATDSTLLNEKQQGKEPDQKGEQEQDSELGQLVEDLAKVVKEVRETQGRRRLLHDQLEELAAKLAANSQPPDRIEELAKQSRSAEQSVSAAQNSVEEAEDALRRASEGAQGARLIVTQAKQRLATATRRLASKRQNLAALRSELPPPSPIVDACFSLDGEQLLFAAQSGDASIFHVDGTPLDQWKAAADGATRAQFAGDGATVALAGQSAASLTLCNTQPTWRLEQTLGSAESSTMPLEGRVLALDFSPDGRLLAIGAGPASSSGQVIVWSLQDDRLHCLLERPHDDAVLGLAFSHDGRHLATASADRMMKVFEINSGALVQSFEGHTHHVLDVAWRANGLQLATSSADKTVKVWDFDRGEQLHTFLDAGKEITGVEYLGVSGRFVAAAADGAARIYDGDDGTAVKTISLSGDYLLSCSVADPGELLVTGGVQRVLRVHDASEGAERRHFVVDDAPAAVP